MNRRLFYILLIHLVSVFLFILGSCLIYWPAPELAFKTDDSPIAWFSSVLLWSLFILTLRLWQEDVLETKASIFLGLSFLIMSFDEQFMLHEHWKYNCIHWTSLCEFKLIRELPMILVAVFGFLTAILIHNAFQNRALRILLWLAISIGLYAMFLRFFQYPIWILPFKGGFLVVAEALFLSSLLSLPTNKKL